MTCLALRSALLTVLWNVGATVSMQNPAVPEVTKVSVDAQAALASSRDSELLRRESVSSSKSLAEAGKRDTKAAASATNQVESAAQIRASSHPEMHLAGGPPGHWEAVADPNIHDGGKNKMVWVSNTPVVSQEPDATGKWVWKKHNNWKTPTYRGVSEGLDVSNGHWTWMPGAKSEVFARDLRPGENWPLGHLKTRWHHGHESMEFERIDPVNGQEVSTHGPPGADGELHHHMMVDQAKQRLHDIQQEHEHPTPSVYHEQFNPYMAEDMALKNFQYDKGQNGELGTWKHIGSQSKKQANKPTQSRHYNDEVKPMNVFPGYQLPHGWKHDTGNLPEPSQDQPETGHSHDWEFHAAYGYKDKGYYTKAHYPVETSTGPQDVVPPPMHWETFGGEGEPASSHGHLSTGYQNPWSHVSQNLGSSFGESQTTGVEEGSADSVLPSLR